MKEDNGLSRIIKQLKVIIPILTFVFFVSGGFYLTRDKASRAMAKAEMNTIAVAKVEKEFSREINRIENDVIDRLARIETKIEALLAKK